MGAFDGIDPSGQTVVFWHPWGTGTTGEGLIAVVDDFNATNEWGITVELVDQGRHRDVEDAMNVAIQSGDVPDLVVGYNDKLDTWYSVGALTDITPYVDDPVVGLTAEEKADFYEGAWNTGIGADGARVGFPFGQSANVLFYNVGWAQELGFDSAPTTWAEFKEQACAAAAANDADDDPDNDGTGGFVLYAGASNFATWVFASGETLVTDDATAYRFNKPATREIMANVKELWDEGCAFATESYPNPEFATRQALFVHSSTAGLPYQISAFEAEGATDDAWGLIPTPGIGGHMAVNSFAQNTGIVATTPEKMLATWYFIKWFASPEVMARWIEASAYHPTRASTVGLLDEYMAANPLWGEGLSLLPYGGSEPGWSSYSSVRRSVGDTFAAIIQGTPDQILDLLAELDESAAEAHAETQ
jgi:ABC-type glycerol-3-phosphate transport system substrate-binding protein